MRELDCMTYFFGFSYTWSTAELKLNRIKDVGVPFVIRLGGGRIVPGIHGQCANSVFLSVHVFNPWSIPVRRPIGWYGRAAQNGAVRHVSRFRCVNAVIFDCLPVLF